MTGERSDARRNRARLLDVAREVYRQGGATVQLADVARAAGVGIGTVHRHFPTRDALLETLAREHLAALTEIAELAVKVEDPAEAVAVLLRGLLAAQLGRHAMAEVLTASIDVEKATTEAKAELDAVVTAVLVTAADFVREDVSAADIRRLIAGIELSLDHRDPATPAHAERQLTIVLAGLRRP